MSQHAHHSLIEKMHSALDDFRGRKLAILIDVSREAPKSCFIAPARYVTAALVNEVLHHGRGHLRVALNEERVRAFGLPSGSRPQLSITNPGAGLVSVEARYGTTTGISASDRAQTVQVLGGKLPQPSDLVHPGHVFPSHVHKGGVLTRHALPEGAFDLIQTSFALDAALYCEILDDKGEWLSLESIKTLATHLHVPLFSLEELTLFRLQEEPLVTQLTETRLPTQCGGELRAILFRTALHAGDHIALVKGDVETSDPVMVRVQPEFTFSDVFGGENPPSRRFLQEALAKIKEAEKGVFIYLRRPLAGQLIRQVQLWQEEFSRRDNAMMQTYGEGAQILRSLGVKKIALLTTSPKKLEGLHAFGIEIVDQIPLARSTPS